ncbi:signal peptide peptidase SppA, 67K type [Candidatus Moduliflexus flocculans]|uniref:Signal peptide peptidase SppA, 67K type n=1 Tax=Candidatus Moduliflexus flocculans TaxID=1499966 RepID=A0A081BN06_9BACT|nr:signal peptide peptidase SppA, 67K type [Candidatus Moduliflexus flocculans]
MSSFRRTRLRISLWRWIKQAFKILRHIFVGVWLALFLALIISVGWFFREVNRVPKVKDNSLLSITLDGMILEGPAFGSTAQHILGEDVQTLRGMLNNLRKATKDPRITGIALTLKGYGMSYGTGSEIREELAQFKAAGKKIFVYMDWAYPGKYLFASLGDKIYMSPSGGMDFAVFSMEMPFYRKLLDKIGITPEHIYIGKYKTGPQPEMLEKMSDEHREVSNILLEAFYNNFVEQAAANRKVSQETVKGWVDSGFFSAKDALEMGLVDELVYEKDFEHALKVELGIMKPGSASATDKPASESKKAENAKDEKEEPELPSVNNSQYARVKVDAPNLYTTGEKIAMIYASGVIISGKSSPIGAQSPMIGSESLTELLEKVRKDKEIKGVIIRLDSGGGGASASDEIRHAVEKLKEKKPVMISMSTLAASGGYMMSAPADKIFAYPLTITGSIGIYSTFYHFQRLQEWLGINMEIIERGKNSGIFSTSRPRTSEETQRMEHYLRQFYDGFVEGVANGRHLTVEATDAIAQGRVWTGRQGLENGLVDEIGGFDEVIAAMKKQLNIPEKDEVQLVEYPELENPWRLLWHRFVNTQIAANVPAALLDAQEELHLIEQLAAERELALLPDLIETPKQ